MYLIKILDPKSYIISVPLVYFFLFIFSIFFFCIFRNTEKIHLQDSTEATKISYKLCPRENTKFNFFFFCSIFSIPSIRFICLLLYFTHTLFSFSFKMIEIPKQFQCIHKYTNTIKIRCFTLYI